MSIASKCSGGAATHCVVQQQRLSQQLSKDSAAVSLRSASSSSSSSSSSSCCSLLAAADKSSSSNPSRWRGLRWDVTPADKKRWPALAAAGRVSCGLHHPTASSAVLLEDNNGSSSTSSSSDGGGTSSSSVVPGPASGWQEFEFHDTPTSRGRAGGVPVYVMLPLDSITMHNTVNRRRALDASLLALKSAGVEGIMVDVWWGIVEKDAPGQYNWSAYKELIDLVRKHGLKVQAVMSFHMCGGNVGDSCHIPLPRWVVEEIDRNPDLVYTDKSMRRNYEYLSLGCDTVPVLRGRTPVQAYADFMRSFRDTFEPLLGEVINEIQVGMGPAGELRYPSYPESNGLWGFPGIGEFQCHDKYMMASLKACAEVAGRPDWGHGAPHDAGHYRQQPEDTGFFHREGSWNSPYGQFFLDWYSSMLLAHGERILAAAEGIFRGTGAHLSGKVAGIHWHYRTRSHAPELTAGYYNTRTRDGYLPIALMFARHGVTLNFTCVEMRDTEQPPQARCSPEGLLRQVAAAARAAGIRLSGENALPRFDQTAHDQVVRNSRLENVPGSGEPLCSFTFLRMCQSLFVSENWCQFVPFVRHMGEGRTFSPWQEEHRDMQWQVHATAPLVQEAVAALTR